VALLVAAGSIGALAVAFILQYGFGLAPCHLCILERYPYAVAAVLALGGLALGRPRSGLALAALALLAGAGIAGFHVGVERGIFTLPESCIAGTTATSIDQLRAQLMTARPTCDQVHAAWLGLSLATWNLLFALALTALAAWGTVARPALRR
jgi:disulfide bond formation protein DsbB